MDWCFPDGTRLSTGMSASKIYGSVCLVTWHFSWIHFKWKVFFWGFFWENKKIWICKCCFLISDLFIVKLLYYISVTLEQIPFILQYCVITSQTAMHSVWLRTIIYSIHLSWQMFPWQSNFHSGISIPKVNPSNFITVNITLIHINFIKITLTMWNTVDSRYLEFQGTLWNTSRYPYLDISDLQNWGKNNSNNHI